MSRFLIACGGTGGHLSPGIALAEELRERGHEVSLLISNKQIDSRLVQKYPHLDFIRQPAAPFGLSPRNFARFVSQLLRGFFHARRLIRERRPDVVFGFGGFTTVPLAIAARFFRVPVALHEANRVPGKAVRLIGPAADRVYVPSGVAMGNLRSAVVRHLNLPVRNEIHRVRKDEARTFFGFNPSQKLLLVLGGSQGARSLNDWAAAQMESLAWDEIQVCCVTGPGKGETVGYAFTSRHGNEVTAKLLPFCDRMGELLSAADLAVSRAGAGTIAELVRCQLPALLVPYPHAADNHQAANADYFERQGGGLMVSEPYLEQLQKEVREVMFNDWLLQKFRDNLARMDRGNAAEQIAVDLEVMIRNSTSHGNGRREGVEVGAL